MELIQVRTPEEMDSVVANILQKIEKAPTDQAVVIGLSGDLGAGKTTFTQAFARSLGITDTVTSPTYVVMKFYPLEPDTLPAEVEGYEQLVHIDAYRIEDIDELRVLGFAELLKQKDTIICIEWPEHIKSALPQNMITVSIAIEGSERTVSISF